MKSDVEAQHLSDGQISTELDRLLSDPDFHATDRNKRFLRYVANETLAGRGNAIKAYSIAVDVFGRPQSFDGTLDPIVRIEATRLRSSLSEYYEHYGKRSSVSIELPRGRYVPIFHSTGLSNASQSDAANPPVDEQASSNRQAVVSSRVLRRLMALPIMLSAAVALTLVCAVSVMAWQTSRHNLSEKPTVVIKWTPEGTVPTAESIAVRDALMVALSQFQTLRVISEQAGFKSDSSTSHNYRVDLKYGSEDVTQFVWWSLVDPDTGELLRSGREAGLGQNAKQQLVSRLASQLAGLKGVINLNEVQRDLAHPTLGNGCILRSFFALEANDKIELDVARICLENTVKLRPGQPEAIAMLAMVLLQQDTGDVDRTIKTISALETASKSSSMSPSSQLAATALMQAQYTAGYVEAAIVSGRRAVSLNPNNAVLLSKLGTLLFIVGRWDEGLELVRESRTLDSSQYASSKIVLGLDAYRRGQFNDALLNSKHSGLPTSYLSHLLLTATLGQLGRSGEAEIAAKNLLEYRPGLESSFRSDMADRHVATELVVALEAGLKKAGLQVPGN